MIASVEEMERADSLLNRLSGSSGLADPLCSRSEWLFAYQEAFAPQRELLLRTSGDSVLALAGVVNPVIGPLLEPIESHWFFPCPLLGPDAIDLLAEVLEEPAQKHVRPCIAISGIQTDNPLIGKLLRTLGGRYEVGCLDPIKFRSASLVGGCDGFLSRRSRKFRCNLRRSVERGGAEEITFERCLPTTDFESDLAYDRMLAVEASSWKGMENCGISQEPFRTFYRLVYKKMCRNGIARAVFAQHEGRDIGFVMGGVDGVHYRGQQFSYLEGWARFSIGNLLQWQQIQWLCEEGLQRYDMGSVLEYKTHWTEIELQSQALVWRPIR